MAGSKDTKVPITIIRGAHIRIVVRDYDDSDWCINDIAGDDNGNIAITGETSKSKSYIGFFSLVAVHGFFTFFDSPTEIAERYCDILPGARIATVTGHEIEIFSTTNTLERICCRNINDLSQGFRVDKSLCCVAWDANNNSIVIGETESRNIYVLDENLNSRTIIALPQSITCPVALNINGENLLVCDETGRGFFSVSTTNQASWRLMETPGERWWPHKVCTDRGGYIYVLWFAVVSEQKRCQLIKYGPQGDQLLSEEVDGHIRNLTTVNTNEGEKLLLAPYSRGIIFERPLLR